MKALNQKISRADGALIAINQRAQSELFEAENFLGRFGLEVVQHPECLGNPLQIIKTPGRLEPIMRIDGRRFEQEPRINGKRFRILLLIKVRSRKSSGHLAGEGLQLGTHVGGQQRLELLLRRLVIFL